MCTDPTAFVDSLAALAVELYLQGHLPVPAEPASRSPE
jgi:hypothetical protein